MKKTYSLHQIKEQYIQKFLSILNSQINLINQLRNCFLAASKSNANEGINLHDLQRIFQEIDFFNNKYIDCAAIVQFCNHYKGQQGNQKYNQMGISYLISIINGSEYTGDKIFIQDLIQFVQNEKTSVQYQNQLSNQNEQLQQQNQLCVNPLEKYPSQLKLISLSSGQSLFTQKLSHIGQIVKNDTASFGKNDSGIKSSAMFRFQCNNSKSHISNLNSKSNVSKQSLEQFDNQQNQHPVNLSISPSASPKSQKDRKDYILQKQFNKTFNSRYKFSHFAKESLVNNIIKLKRKQSQDFKNNQNNKLETQNRNLLTLIQQKEKYKNVKNYQVIYEQHEYLIPEKQKYFSNPNQKQKYKNLQNKINQNQQSVEILPINSTYRHPNKSQFESSLIKNHYRNSSYLNQIKLIDDPIVSFNNKNLKIQGNFQNNIISNNKALINSQVTQKRQTSINKIYNQRPCTYSKTSIFEQKKIQLIFNMQLLGQQYHRWYSQIKKLIQQNQKFTFINAFNIIDIQQNNQVTIKDFIQFLKDCDIQKKSSKVQKFFNFYSTSLVKINKNREEDFDNKQNQFRNSSYEGDQNHKQNQNIMRFSDFLKVFYLNSATSLIIKCKRRNPQINQKWDNKMKSDYCNFFRILIDCVDQINILKKGLKNTYFQLLQMSGQQSFQKIFGRQIMRFDQMDKILGKNSIHLLAEISRDQQYIDNEKLSEYLKNQNLNLLKIKQ